MLVPDASVGRVVTFSVAEGAQQLGVTEAWYLGRLRARRLPGHKLGRTWRLTEGDVAQALELTAVPHVVPANPWGLTPGSLRRLNRGRG